MEKQDIPVTIEDVEKKSKSIFGFSESVIYTLHWAILWASILFCLLGSSYIFALNKLYYLTYGGIILMKLFLGTLFVFALLLYIKVFYELFWRTKIRRKEKREELKQELKLEILKEIKSGRSKAR